MCFKWKFWKVITSTVKFRKSCFIIFPVLVETKLMFFLGRDFFVISVSRFELFLNNVRLEAGAHINIS